MQYSNKNEWLEAAQEAATHMAPGEASRFLRSWEQWVGRPVETAHEDENLEALRQNLFLTAFSLANDEHAVFVLENLTREFLLGNEYQLPALSKVEDRIVAVGYGLYEEERLRIRGALEKSGLSLWGHSVKEWLARHDQFLAQKPEGTLQEFYLKDAYFQSAQGTEKQLLENLFEIYDAYLVEPVFSIFDYQALEEEGIIRATAREDVSVLKKDGSVIKLPVLQALSQYPNLGNQNISQERIKIKSQPEPVRGSLYNWIKYYRDELGIGQHSTVERGQFLFRSANGKALSATERERVNLILKSLEENLPLEIDTERQEIIFPVIDVATSVPSQPPISAPQAQVFTTPKIEAPVRPAPKPFVPQPIPPQPTPATDMASKFQPSPSPYQKMSIPPEVLSPDRAPLPGSGIDVSQMAERLKREPKPEWIKGTFTKDSIPESAPIAQATGAMSFSFNHALPAEQEASPQQGASAPTERAKAPGQGIPAAPKGSSQFHIRPVSRRDQ